MDLDAVVISKRLPDMLDMLDGKPTQNRFFSRVECIAWHGGALHHKLPQPTALGQPKENKQQSDKQTVVPLAMLETKRFKAFRKIQMLLNKLLV